MIYKVLQKFADLQDSYPTKSGKVYHVYEIGDVYPRDGYEASEERIEELSSSNNAQKHPLISPLGGTPSVDSLRGQIKQVSEKMTKKQLLEIADEKGIKIPSKATKADIIKIFQEVGGQQ